MPTAAPASLHPATSPTAPERPSPLPAWQHVPPWRPNEQTFGDTRVTPAEARAGIVADASGVVRVKPARTVQPETVDQLRAQFATARREQLRVTVAGTRHSGGGQSLQTGTLLLDMRRMDGLRFDAASGALDVQPGATWEQVQRFLDPHGRAVAVAQSSNIFSVGGSLATNIHGRDVRFGPIIDTVESVKVLLADGREVTASPRQRPDLFSLVIGGYGQAGVITEARLRTVPNEVYRRTVRPLEIDALPGYYEQLKHDPAARMSQVRLPVSRRQMFDRALAIEYRPVAGGQPEPMEPRHSGGLGQAVTGAIFRAGIFSDLVKDALWTLQNRIHAATGIAEGSRNQVMSPDAEYLRSSSRTHRQVLQEYFVPPERMPAFLRRLEHAAREHDANLLNLTLRFTPAQRQPTALSYSTKDTVAAVLYLDQRTGAAAQERMDAFTRAAAQAAVDERGSFYLPYQLGAFTPQQLDRAYPARGEFFRSVRRWDPHNLFAGAIESIDPTRDGDRLAG